MQLEESKEQGIDGLLNNESLRAFLGHLIDYAGLFPPARLSLREAIQNYASYKLEQDVWMLGHFVIRASELPKLSTYVNLFSAQTPLVISATGSRTESFDGCLAQLEDDLKVIHDFRSKYGEQVEINAFELPLPAKIPRQHDLQNIAVLTVGQGLKPFCELTIPLNSDKWEEDILATLDVIAVHNAKSEQKLGMKLRTGGIKPNMFPSPKQVASFIHGCIERRLQLKFTAGLHHPMRMYREEVQTKMYGFLNVFLAVILGEIYRLDKNAIKEILSDEDPGSFIFQSDYMAWRDLKVTAYEIGQVRKTILSSYGSCSFDEPREELRELIKKQE